MKVERGNVALRRIHVPAHLWQSMPGTDYWIVASSADMVTASGATNLSGLDSFGWTTTTLGVTNLATADFMSSADDTPPIIQGADTTDVLKSPVIFGNYSHQLLASKLLGYMPTQLIAEFYGAFTVATANETGSFMGLDNAAGSTALIHSNTNNFALKCGANTDVGAAVDNAYHLWKIVVGSTTTEWFIDGVSQGTVTTTVDVWPSGFACEAFTTNRWALSWGHVFYE